MKFWCKQTRRLPAPGGAVVRTSGKGLETLLLSLWTQDLRVPGGGWQTGDRQADRQEELMDG